MESFGWVSALGLEGRTIWIVDAHRDGKRFIVRADEMLTLGLSWAYRSPNPAVILSRVSRDSLLFGA